MILPIQSLRGIFAILIFLHHYTINRLPMIDAGNISVAFFMMLSGTVLSIGYGQRVLDRRISYRDFVSGRLARIYPLYFITLIGGIILFSQNHSSDSILPIATDFFMLQSWIPSQQFYFSGNPPSWCIPDFLFFYLIFPPLYRLIARRPVAFISGLLGVLALYFSLTPLIPYDLIEPLTYISPLFRSLDFILGLCIGYYICSAPRPSHTSRLRASLLELAVAAICIAFYAIQDFATPLYNNASWWWIPLTLLIYTFTRQPYGHGILSSLLSLKPFVWLGSISYPLFMGGYICIMAVKLTARHFHLDLNSPAVIATALIVAIPAAYLLHLIDTRIHRRR